MQTELHSLSKIFSEAILRIPDYQRGYAWQEKQLKDFWSDLERLSADRNHYTGVLTFEPATKEAYDQWQDDTWIIESKKYRPYYIVDGQQRLTTAIILLQVITESIADHDQLNFTNKDEIRKKYLFESKDRGISRSYLFGYERDNPSHEFLKTSILGEQSEVHSTQEETIYTTNLKSAKAFFKEKINGLDIKIIESLYTKLTQNLQFNIFYIDPSLDVFVTFETMNNRGKPLSQLELLKNRLIYLCAELNEEKSEKNRLRRKINEAWKAIYHYLGKNESRLLSDDLFLHTHFFAYHGPDFDRIDPDDPEETDFDIRKYVRNRDLHKSYLLDEIFTIKRLQDIGSDKLTLSEIDHYAQDIKKSVEIYYYLFDPEKSPYSSDEKIALQRLARNDANDIKLLCLVANQVISESDRKTALFQAIERFSFIRRLRPHALNSVGIEQLAIKLKAADLTPQDIIRTLKGESDKFITSVDFHDTIRTIGKGDGYYGWRGLRYFMYEYEQELRSQSKTARQLLNWDTFKQENYEIDHKTIEHIYPQRATDPYWKDKFPSATFSLSERNILKHSLGNLLPVSSPKNSSLNNKSFLLKKGSTSNPVGYKYGCLSEVQVSDYADWTPLHIVARGVKLLKFMESRWDISLGDDHNKVKLLGLEFVLNRLGANMEAVLKI